MGTTLEVAIQAVKDVVTEGWHNITDLVEFAGRLKPAKPVPSGKIASIDDLGSIWQVESKLNWLVPDLLAEGSVNLICSASGTGKTWFAYFLAGAVAHGGEVFGEQVKQRKVLYVDGENPAFVVKQRLPDLGIAETPDLKVWGGWQPEPPPKPDHPLIQEFAEKEKPLLIWDSLVEFHTGDEQSAKETRDFMKKYRHLSNLGATVLILHHTGKAETSKDYRGSSDIEAAVDMAFKLEAHGNAKTVLDELELGAFKTRFGPLPTRLLKYSQGKGFTLSAILTRPATSGPDPVEVIKGIVAVGAGLNQGAIVALAKEAKISKHDTEKTLKRHDVFRTEKGKGRENRYYLVEQPVAVQEEVPVEEPVPAPAQDGPEAPAVDREAA